MYCGACGQENPGPHTFCPTCGKSLKVEALCPAGQEDSSGWAWETNLLLGSLIFASLCWMFSVAEEFVVGLWTAKWISTSVLVVSGVLCLTRRSGILKQRVAHSRKSKSEQVVGRLLALVIALCLAWGGFHYFGFIGGIVGVLWAAGVLANTFKENMKSGIGILFNMGKVALWFLLAYVLYLLSKSF